MTSLESVTFEDGVQFSRNIFGMFTGCTSLTYVDFSNVGTANVEEMGQLFTDCESLKTIDLSGLDTQNVRDMRQMFFRMHFFDNFGFVGS